MPRSPDPSNRCQQERMRRYRRKLQLGLIPEACHVDTAVAAATTAVSASMQRDGRMTAEAKRVIDGIVEATVRVLVADGYSEAASRAIALRRMTRWQSVRAQRSLMRKAGLDSAAPPAGVRR